MDDDMANLIVAQLLYLDAADPNRVCFQKLSSSNCFSVHCGFRYKIFGHNISYFETAPIWLWFHYYLRKFVVMEFLEKGSSSCETGLTYVAN